MASNRFIYYILAAFIAGNLLLIFIQYNSSKNIDNLITGNEKILNEFTLENELRDLRKNIISVETSISRAIDTRNTSHVKDLQQEIAAAEINLGKLQKVDDNDSSVIFIDRLDELVHEKINFNNTLLQTFYHSGRLAADSLIHNGRQIELTDSITQVTHKIDNSRRNLLTSITASIDKSGQNARRWGTILFILLSCSGAALFWFIINRVRKQNQLILQLDASQKQVKEAAKVKENFMANMSHEIRTPMNAIIGFTSLLQKQKLDPDAVVYVQSIQKSGESLLTIVNDILDFSKFEAGMVRIEPVPFSLREMLQSIQTMFYQKTKEKNLSLAVTVNDNVPDTLEGDASRLTQILVNLIGNAVKFTDHGSIHVNAGNAGSSNNTIQLSFSVKDTGIGIEKNELTGIFERFRQAEASITRKYGGTGLGLSIVKDLVTLQNGTIMVDSEPGKGSEFRFIIPYKIIDKIPAADFAEINTSISEAFHHASILVVEDNEINQTLMKHLLTGWQLSFTIASSGKEAIDYLQQKTFDLVLMDIQMPEMDGYTAARKIRQQLQLNIPIVAMTAHALAGEREKCIACGMNDYISKPLQEATLLKIITQFIQGIPMVEENSNPIKFNEFTCINLQYMKEISNGNIDYEKTVTEQFIEMIPGDLIALETAVQTKKINTIKDIAHNMKTTVSVMGLTDILLPYLDALEYESQDEAQYRENITRVKNICTKALEEARIFYSSL